MESKIIITLSWQGPMKADDHLSILEQLGQERAFEMIPQGYSSGELNADLTYETPSGKEKEQNYRGWWSVEFES